MQMINRMKTGGGFIRPNKNLEKYLDDIIFNRAEQMKMYVNELHVHPLYVMILAHYLGDRFDITTHREIIALGIVGYYRCASIYINNDISFGSIKVFVDNYNE